MPLRPWTRDQHWTLPPSLDACVAPDHPVRFVAAFLEELTAADWAELGIDPAGNPRGAPAYDPRVLLAIWVYGFMTGIRSCRKLAVACREQLPFLWLTGWQTPDHNTLWRFYQAHRQGMRALFKRTVATAARTGLVVWAVQAVDGTKIGGNAAKDRTLDAAALTKLLERTEQAIADLEAQEATDGPPTPPRLPPALARAEALRARVRDALAQVTAADGPPRVNLTDPDAGLVKGRQGVIAGDHAQAVAATVRLATRRRPKEPSARLITAADVVPAADDHGQLLPMLAQAEAVTGRGIDLALSDGGYHDGPTLAACADRGQRVAMPEAQQQALTDPFHKDRFRYDAATDTYSCPAGQVLRFRSTKERTDRPPVRVYKAGAAVCRAGPLVGHCTTDRRQGRALEIGPHEAVLRQHRVWMATAEAQTAYRERKTVIEPVFGVLKEELGARRFLVRGLANVRAEWRLLATGFNLRTLYRLGQRQREETRLAVAA